MSRTKKNYPLLEDIGKKIKAGREEKGFTFEELGKLVGLSHQHIRRLERGENEVSAFLLARIAKVLDKDITMLLENVENLPQPDEKLQERLREKYEARESGPKRTVFEICRYISQNDFASAAYLVETHKDIPKDPFYAAMIIGLSKQLDELGHFESKTYNHATKALEELIAYYKKECSYFKKR